MAMGCSTRVMALVIIVVFLGATAVGSVLPEFGNLLATRLSLRAHQFNILFCAVGIIGVGLALYLGYKNSR